jgi:hypothetical protein
MRTGEKGALVSLQERVEATVAGRALITGVILLVLIGLAVWNLPSSKLHDDLLPVVRPYMNATGLDQNWAIFAPDPRSQALQLKAILTYDDGVTSEVVGAPTGDVVIGPYRFYRWSKWVENVRSDALMSLWKPTAEFIARQHQRNGRLPVRVTLVRRWYDITAPGAPARRSRWQQFAYYTLDLARQASGPSGVSR